MTKPNYIFEVSWEVCNKVGGIYTVLSSRALKMTNVFKEKVFFIGPYIWHNSSPIDFEPTKDFGDFERYLLAQYGLKAVIGKWKVPGSPTAILVDFLPIYTKKNEIYGDFWESYGVNSIEAYGDYDEASMFGYASGVAIKAFVEFYKIDKRRNVAHFNEWMTSFGLFYIKSFAPKIKTLFTTHATTIGRSIAGNGKPLYDYLKRYNGDQMARELNVVAKHSAEKAAAHFADCFTTVSNITGKECEILLSKKPDIITPNGFDNSFVPVDKRYESKKKQAKKILKTLAEKTLGYKLSGEHLFVGISGRYEYKNKGIDVFIDAMNNLKGKQELTKKIVAFILVPAWVKENCYSNSKFVTSALINEENDAALSYIRQNNFRNEKSDRVKIIFVPTYLNGNDGALNLPYYDILIGLDFTIFPSYYEPWGYTPMESAAFGIPTVTTSLAGFGQWVSSTEVDINNGIAVIDRTDSNYFEVVNSVANQIAIYAKKSDIQRKNISDLAKRTAQKALWNKFFEHYIEAYHFALSK